jgi:hypothetical protein
MCQQPLIIDCCFKALPFLGRHDIQHNGIRHNATWHKNKNAKLNITKFGLLRSIRVLCFFMLAFVYAEFCKYVHFPERRYAECRYVKCHRVIPLPFCQNLFP